MSKFIDKYFMDRESFFKEYVPFFTELLTHEGEGDGGSGDSGGDDGGAPPSQSTTFTQEQLNSTIAAEKRKWKEANDRKVAELQSQLEKLNLADQDRTSLQEQFNVFKNDALSKEQQLTRELDGERKGHKKTKETLESERDAWRNRFTETILTNEILASASEKPKAFVPEQLVGILRGQHKLELKEAVGPDGKPTGIFEGWVIGFRDVDPEGRDVVIDLRIPDAIKRMKELPSRFGNLFETDATSGLNLTGGDRKKDQPIDLNDAASFRQRRKELLNKK